MKHKALLDVFMLNVEGVSPSLNVKQCSCVADWKAMDPFCGQARRAQVPLNWLLLSVP